MGKETKRRSDVIYIDLIQQFPAEGDLQFLRAELPKGRYRWILALVRYALYGYEAPSGLRLDLDKKCFIDHFDDKLGEIEKSAQKSAPFICDYLYTKLYKKK